MSYREACQLPVGTKIHAMVRQMHTGQTEMIDLIRVDGGDHDFRTADDNSEISFMWDIVSWELDHAQTEEEKRIC